MNSLMRAANFIIAGALKRHQAFASKKAIFADLPTILGTNARQAHNLPNTYDFARERILLVLRLYDKIDPEKLTLDSHFYDDLGLDSLDHVEIIMNMEEEFNYEIPDKDAEKLLRPSDLLRYITDKDEAYEELQRLEMEDHHNHHGHGHGHGHEHDHEHEQAPAINHSVGHSQTVNMANHVRSFSTSSYMANKPDLKTLNNKSEAIKYTTSKANLDYRSIENFTGDRDRDLPNSHNYFISVPMLFAVVYGIFLRDEDDGGFKEWIKPVHEVVPELAIPIIKSAIDENRKAGHSTRDLERKLDELIKKEEAGK